MTYNADGKINMVDLNEMINIFYFSTGIPIISFDEKRIPQGNHLPDKSEKFPLENFKNYDLEKIYRDINNDFYRDCEYYYTNELYENYIIVTLWHNDNFKGILIAGPILIKKITLSQIDHFIHIYNLKGNLKRTLMDYYSQLPIISFKQYQHIGLLLQTLSHSHIAHSRYVEDFHKVLDKKSNFNKQLLICKEAITSRMPYQLEQQLWKSVREGDLPTINKLIPEFSKYNLLDESIRSMKNVAIIICSYLRINAIEGGLEPNMASTLSDCYLLMIEKQVKQSDLAILIHKMTIEFVTQVKRCNTHVYSSTVQRAINYISCHLNESLTLNQVASQINIHPSYLSNLFKKEVKITFKNYILNKRIKEAKYLLEYSSDSILDIALHLGYCNQAYFTRIFKELEGMTPTQYRNETCKIE